jgi:hypothetical protein
MVTTIKVAANRIPELIKELQLVQKIIDENQEILVELDRTLDLHFVLDVFEETALKLSRMSLPPSELNAIVRERKYKEESPFGKEQVSSKNPEVFLEDYFWETTPQRLETFYYDKLQDGTVSLERFKIKCLIPQFSEELQSYFENAALVAAQVRASARNFETNCFIHTEKSSMKKTSQTGFCLFKVKPSHLALSNSNFLSRKIEKKLSNRKFYRNKRYHLRNVRKMKPSIKNKKVQSFTH